MSETLTGAAPLAPPTIAVIVPTYNERPNVALIVESVAQNLAAERWELIFVDDDSPDGTCAEVERVAATDARVRRLRRLGRRGLSSACIEGMLSTTAPFLAVMDGDAQHDATLLPRMLDAARSRKRDVVIASRGLGAGREEFRGAFRRALTRGGNAAARALVGRHIQDPLSGFFLVRRDVFSARAPALYGQGFKILLDILSANRELLQVEEMPTRLHERAAGESKLGVRAGLDALALLSFRLAGRALSPRFALYCAVGLSGVAVHLTVLQASFGLFGRHFLPAQALAAFVAMTSNFFLNNVITFADRKLRGVDLWQGLLSFYLTCATGAVISVAIGDLLFNANLPLWAAGVGGALVAAAWNFSLNATLTWRAK